MDRDQYIGEVEEGLIARRFEEIPPNDLFNAKTEEKFLGFTISEKKDVKEYLLQFVVYARREDRPSLQDDILEYVVICLPELNTPEIREDRKRSPTTEIRDDCAFITDGVNVFEFAMDTKIFVHVLFITDNGTKHMKTAVKENKSVHFPDFGILPVLADTGNETLTYNTENEGSKGIVGTPYTKQLNERADEYFSVSE